MAVLIKLLFLSFRHYRWFLATVAVAATQEIGFLITYQNTEAYTLLWLITNPLFVIGIVCAGLEILYRIPEQYGRPHQQVNRQRLLNTFQIALAIALASAAIDLVLIRNRPAWSLWTTRQLIFTRVTTFLVALLLFFAERFVALVPVPFQKNLRIHSRLFGAWVMMDSLATLGGAITAYGTKLDMMNTVMEGGGCALFVAWFVLLTKEGEEGPRRPASGDGDLPTLRSRGQEMLNNLRRALPR